MPKIELNAKEVSDLLTIGLFMKGYIAKPEAALWKGTLYLNPIRLEVNNAVIPKPEPLPANKEENYRLGSWKEEAA